ncbi:MAG: RNA-binding transcriptional accessory protein [Clostridiales bacterium]|nr:RNA-binding transcriptional accessory protein [Clostridiales bacterium]
MDKTSYISTLLNIPLHKVKAAVSLLDEGATIPFISRYRKEATGSLDEVQLFDIQRSAKQYDELAKRKETVLSTLSETGQLTDLLSERIAGTTTLTELEDIYLPFKPHRRTRATIAREHGLEPLARMLMGHRLQSSPQQLAGRFLNNDITTEQEALDGARDIIAEWISESETARQAMRRLYERKATITTKVAKGHDDDTQYADYHNYSSPLNRCPSHRYLAMRRAEKEGILKVSIDVDTDEALDRLDRIFTKNISPLALPVINDAIADSYKRLLKPSIENDAAATTKASADKVAIGIFADNLRQLLMAPPLGHRRVMGIDPGFRTGCKVVCLDESGRLLHHDVIYPTPPRQDVAGAQSTILQLVDLYKVEAIAVGNGTASRETERFLKSIEWGHQRPDIHIVNEAGASVYSASELARRELPDHDVTVRGAVSIARRLIDPMAELVKIDPKAIGVGQYQHDVDQASLKESLDHTVGSCVNSVGINLNTASPELLSYISGIGPKLAAAIVDYRGANGPFTSRSQLLEVPRLGNKVYTQAAGFLRLPGAANPLDNTAVHPERYKLVERMAADAGCTTARLIQSAEARQSIDLSRYIGGDVGLPTLQDIMAELARPGRDPRGEVTNPAFDDTINDITDLHPGMTLPGVVNNITAFGAFVDLGIHQSGLVHISQLSDSFISHPSQAVQLGQHVNVRVLEVDTTRQRISLTMKGIAQ